MAIQNRAAAVVILLLVCAACGDDDTQAASATAPGAAAPGVTAVTPTAAATGGSEERPDPCALLTEAVIRSTFEVPADTAIDRPPVGNRVHAACRYMWEKPNADELRAEIQAQQQERVREMVKQARHGKIGQGVLDMAMNLPRLENRVSMNFSDPSESAAEARRKYDESGRVLEEGITHRVNIDETMPGASKQVRAQVDGQEFTFQASSTPVEGLGDAARWAERLNQLSVLDGNQILNITVEMETDRDANLEHAKRLARALLH